MAVDPPPPLFGSIQAYARATAQSTITQSPQFAGFAGRQPTLQMQRDLSTPMAAQQVSFTTDNSPTPGAIEAQVSTGYWAFQQPAFTPTYAPTAPDSTVWTVAPDLHAATTDPLSAEVHASNPLSQVLPPLTAPTNFGHEHPVRQRQEPKGKRQTKEQRRKAARTSNADSPQQRPHRCFCCRHDPGNRGCFNYPICDRCFLKHQKCRPSTHLQVEQFIDCQRWLSICQELVEASTVSPILRSAPVSSNSAQRESSEPVIVELNFYDRVRRDNLTPHVIVFRPELQALRTTEDAGRIPVQPRQPAFYRKDLDDLVLNEIWGLPLVHSNDSSTSAKEIVFWSTIRLFIGYHVMIHNLATTFIQSSDFVAASVLGRIVAELIYACGFHLQMHYHELFVSLSEPAIPPQGAPMNPAIRLYGFEVLLGLLESMKSTDWGIPTHLPQHSLTLLQQYFNEQVDHVICQFSFLQCHASGTCTKNRRKRAPPAIVDFARSLPATGFPKHCVLTVSRHRNAIMPDVPSSWPTGDKYRGVDILTHAYDGAFTNIESHDPRSWSSFEDVVDERGMVLNISSLALSSLNRPGTPGSNVPEAQSDTRKADSDISELTVRLLALQEDVDMAEHMSNPETPEYVDSVDVDENALPSLASGTPLSVFSPATPGYFAGMLRHWHYDEASPYSL